MLEGIMRDMKKFTSVKIIEAIRNESESRRDWMLSIFRTAGKSNGNNTTYQFWQQDNHPIECNTAEILAQKMEYVHENSVKAGFVERAEDWMFSSGPDYYANRKGLVELTYV